MTPKKNRAIWPKDMPELHNLALVSHKEAIDTEPDIFYKDRLIDQHSLLKQAELWWVSKPMAILSSSAKEDLPPEVTYQDTRPSTAGIIVYEGGTGITTPWEDAPEEARKISSFGTIIYPEVEIIGAIWCAGKIYALTESAIVKRVGTKDKAFILAISESARKHLEKILICTWLLAEQPHIGARHHERIAIHGPQNKPKHEGVVRIIKLREGLKHHESWREDSQKAGNWKLKHRTLVRGHWRKQRFGQGLDSERPIYIQPYIKGPSGAKLIVRPTVKVWSR